MAQFVPVEVAHDFDFPQREAAFFYGLFLRGHSPEQLRRDIEVPPAVLAKWHREAEREPELRDIFFRLVEEGDTTRAAVKEAAGDLVEANEVLCIPALRLGALPGFETAVMSYTTDIPAFAGMWGRPYLLGPGTIHVAHTSEERIPKREIIEAIQIYKKMIRQLQAA